jgi:hypothetical protein
MITELPSRIKTLVISQKVIDASRALIEPGRENGTECCILWYGYVLDQETCIATTCVYPPQINRPRSYDIPVQAMKLVRKEVRAHGQLLVLQIHTHPQLAYFSEWDAEHALNKQQGALNLVLPDYGNAAWIDTERFCMVEMNNRDQWQPWAADDWQRLTIVPDVIASSS